MVCCSLLALLAASASGAQISFTVVADNGGANYLAGGDPGTFTLSQFNSALGTLTGVSLQVTGNSIGGFNSLDNESATRSGTATLTIGSDVTVSSTVDTLLVLVNPTQTAAGSVARDSDGAADFTGTDAVTVIGTSSTDTQSSSPVSFLPYIGTGSILYSFSSSANTAVALTAGTLSFSSLAFDSDNPSFNFTATVTYNYEPNLDPPPPQVPEPGTLGMAVTLGVLGLSRLRRGLRAKR
jgi:hypothetical protein